VSTYAGPVQDLIDELGRLPGVGPKSAQRIAFHLLKLPKADALRLAGSIVEVKDKVTFCPRCFNIAEGAECHICADTRRNTTVICVVEEPRDIVSVERTGEFKGRYHVLQGAISSGTCQGGEKEAGYAPCSRRRTCGVIMAGLRQLPWRRS